MYVNAILHFISSHRIPTQLCCKLESFPANEKQRETGLPLLLAVAQADDGPSAAPCPLAGTAVAAAALGGSELLVFTLLETNDDVGLDCAEGEDSEARAGAERANGFGEGSGGVPEALRTEESVCSIFGHLVG